MHVDGKHPPYGHRAYAIRQTLRRMNDEAPRRRSFDATIDLLGSSWGNACGAVGVPPWPSEPEATWIDGQVGVMYTMLQGEPLLRFQEWDTAQANVNLLEGAAVPAAPGRDGSIRALLNTAWISRLGGGDPGCIHRNFVALARSRLNGSGRRADR